jgi:hypothetical protein
LRESQKNIWTLAEFERAEPWLPEMNTAALRSSMIAQLKMGDV